MIMSQLKNAVRGVGALQWMPKNVREPMADVMAVWMPGGAAVGARRQAQSAD